MSGGDFPHLRRIERHVAARPVDSAVGVEIDGGNVAERLCIQFARTASAFRDDADRLPEVQLAADVHFVERAFDHLHVPVALARVAVYPLEPVAAGVAC